MIREIGKAELREAVELVNKVFHEFVAVDYGDEGKKTFQNYIEHKYEELEAEQASENKKFWGYFEDGRVLGVIAVRMDEYQPEAEAQNREARQGQDQKQGRGQAGPSLHPHIALLFVDKTQHRKGIARRLFAAAEREYSPYPVMTVNSSPYAVEVYRRLGFEKTAEEQENDGIRYVPMKRVTGSR